MTPISVYNQAATPLGLDLDALIVALQAYVDQCVGPAWQLSCALKSTHGPVDGTCNFAFLDDADSPGALAYHSVIDGLPIAKVFVRTTLQAGESIAVSASHELAELLVDPGCNLTATGKDGTTYAYEACDPVEETTFNLAGFDLSDFVLPAYFNPHTPSGTQLDYCKVLAAPFTMAPGGYQSVLQSGDWTEVFGSRDKAARFATEDRRGHRSEYRRCVTSKSTNAIVAAMQDV